MTAEMECASYNLACSSFRGAEFTQLLYTADFLANGARYEERGWGKDSMLPALQLCLETAAKLPE